MLCYIDLKWENYSIFVSVCLNLIQKVVTPMHRLIWLIISRWLISDILQLGCRKLERLRFMCINWMLLCKFRNCVIRLIWRIHRCWYLCYRWGFAGIFNQEHSFYWSWILKNVQNHSRNHWTAFYAIQTHQPVSQYLQWNATRTS